MELTEGTERENKKVRDYERAGMRRVRLLVWWLFHKVPLDQAINTTAERLAAQRCKLTWRAYLKLKRLHPQVWERETAKRQGAIEAGGWPEQPVQLWRVRHLTNPGRAKERRSRQRAERGDGNEAHRAGLEYLGYDNASLGF